ncbi:jg3353 [Pararge aegeria aegeria]|uniref:Jg3353 protein n=1 Tax=Pararge aegeria aegeria TaxID=348720 RepID=A0A8S4RTY9_9NEOP|nr:jg3353 [Pararge aegeria aegeria]
MGNVQCCANDRLREGKPPKKPKNKKSKKKPKGNSEKTNGVGGCKVDQSVQKAATVAEDTSERVAPKAAQAQSSPASEDSVKKSQESINLTPSSETNSDSSDIPKNENMTTARERFFGQVPYRIYFRLIPIKLEGA